MATNSRIRGITIEIGATTTPLTKALAGVDSALATTQRNIRDLDNALKLDPGNVDLIKDKQKELASEIESTEKKLETEKEALRQLEQTQGFDKNSQQARNLKTQIDLDTAALKDLKKEAQDTSSTFGLKMEAMGNKVKAVGDKISEVGDKISKLGTDLTTKVTVPIVTAFGGAVKSAVDWESAFAGVKKTVEGTDEEYAQLADAIKQMATETASSKEDIAGVMEVSGQLGVTGVDGLTAFTKTMVMLGDTTNLSSEEAATSLARFMNITGESYTDADKLGSAIVDLGNNFATSESEIVAMSTRLASAGTVAGLSSTDILGLSAAMSSVGIQAEAGGTAMTQTLTAISSAVEGIDVSIEDIEKAEKKVATASRAVESAQDNLKKKQISYNEVVKKHGEASAQAQKALVDLEAAERKVQDKTDDLTLAQDKLASMTEGSGDKLELIAQVAGMSADEFTNAWQTRPIDALNAFITGLSKMDEEGESTIAILDTLEMNGVRQSNMLRSLSLASDQLSGAMETSNEAYENNTALQEEANKRYETQAAKMNQLKERFMEVAIEVGERLMPYVEKLMDFIEELIGKWDALDDSEKDQIIQIGLIIAAIGPALIIIGKVITVIGTLISTVGTIMSIVGAAGPAIAAIGAVLTGPVGIILAIIAAVAALAAAIYLNWDRIKEWTAELGRKIAAFGEDVKKGWTNLKADASQKWNDIKNTVNSKVSDAVTSAKNKWNEAKEATGRLWGAMKTEVEKNGGGIKGFLKTSAEGWRQFIVNAWEKADEKTGGALSNMLNAVKEKAGNIRDTIEEKIGAAIDFIKDLPNQALQWGKDLISNFIDGIKNAPANLASAASGVADTIASYLHFSEPDKGPLSDFHTFAPDMVRLFAQGIENSLPTLERASADMASALVPGMGAVQNGTGTTATTYNTPVNITVYGAQGQDVNALADVIQARLNRAVVNQKAVFA